MGNQSCVADGANPHKMTMTLTNDTEHTIYLDKSYVCECPEQHQGYHAIHGKFKDGYQPNGSIAPNNWEIIIVSGREVSKFGKIILLFSSL